MSNDQFVRVFNRPDILKALRLQKEKFELARGSQLSKYLMDLILLAFYTSMPPARALEIRTLEKFYDTLDRPFVKAQNKGRNLLLQRLNKSYVLYFQNFKTKTSRPSDEVEVKVRKDRPLVKITCVCVCVCVCVSAC